MATVPCVADAGVDANVGVRRVRLSQVPSAMPLLPALALSQLLALVPPPPPALVPPALPPSPQPAPPPPPPPLAEATPIALIRATATRPTRIFAMPDLFMMCLL
jgi:hypothetical protein